MKKIILAGALTCLVACSLFLASCGKKIPFSIVGTWEIRASQASIIPTRNYPPGNDSLLIFTPGTYRVSSKGQTLKSGSYNIVRDNSFDALVVPSGQYKYRIIYDGNTGGNKIFLQVTGNTLTFLSGDFSVDGGSMLQYEKE